MSLLFAAVTASFRNRGGGVPPEPVGGASYVFPTHVDESSVEDRFYAQVSAASLTGPWTTNTTLPGSDPQSATGMEINHTATGLAYDTRYWGRIIANNEVGDSSSTYTAFEFWTAPEPTPVLVAVAASSTQINLAWTHVGDPSNGGFIIAEGGVEIARVAGNTRTYARVGLSSATAYDFTVRPYNSNPDIIAPGGTFTQPDSLGTISNTATESTEVSPYFWQYDFDGGEGDYSDWTLDLGTNTANFADTTLVHAGNSLRISESGAASAASANPPVIAPAADKYFFFASKSQGGEQVLLGMGQLAIWLAGFGLSRSIVIRLNYSTVLGSTGEITPTDSPLYYWVHWRKSTGASDGLLEVVFSADTNRPGTLDGTNSLTVAHNVTDELPEISFYKIPGGGGQYVAFDYIRGSFNPIESNPS